jgi:hypothetical protein
MIFNPLMFMVRPHGTLHTLNDHLYSFTKRATFNLLRLTLLSRLAPSALCLPQLSLDRLPFLLREEQIARQPFATNSTEHVASAVNHRTAEWTCGAHQMPIRKRGYPAALAELDAWYPSVPTAENAALVYTNAFALLTNPAGPITNFMDKSWLPSLGQGLSAEEKSELTDVLKAN